MKIAISSITKNGEETAKFLAGFFPGSEVFNLQGKGLLKKWTEEKFHKFEGHIFIMSMGIVYRIIAPLITNKYNDPAVVVVDDARRHAIAALSGHEGGANRLTFKVAQILDAQPVVTTASETNKRIIIGIGCRKGTSCKDIERAVLKTLEENNLQREDTRIAASVDIKKGEPGLIEAFDNMNIPLLFISSEKIKTFTGYKNVSVAALRRLGLPGVSEPCALLAGRNTALILERTIIGPVTIALAKEDEK